MCLDVNRGDRNNRYRCTQRLVISPEYADQSPCEVAYLYVFFLIYSVDLYCRCESRHYLTTLTFLRLIIDTSRLKHSHDSGSYTLRYQHT